MTLKEEGETQENVKVVFKYKDQVQEARTDRDGKASVTFAYVDDSGVEAVPEAYNSHLRVQKRRKLRRGFGGIDGRQRWSGAGVCLNRDPLRYTRPVRFGLSMLAGGGVAYARSKKQK